MSLREHLASRHMHDPSLYHAVIDEVEGVVTFPLWNLSGQWIGHQHYRPEATKTKNNDFKLSRYHAYRPFDRIGVFGLETWRYSRAVFVQEGLFDSVRLHSLGYSSIAVLSDSPKFLGSWLDVVSRSRPVISILDGGNAGDLMGRYVHRSYKLPEGMDVSDAPDEILSDALQFLRHGY